MAAARDWAPMMDPGGTFDLLFIREYARVTGIAYRVLGDAHEAEDVAQDVFCDLYRRHDPEMPHAVPWLYRAATHTALNVIRSRKRRERREEAVAIPEEDSGADPQWQAIDAERRSEVRVALGRLPEKQAAVLVLRYSGLSYAEVAAALGVKIGQVGTLLRRAEVSLRKEMIDATPR